MPLSCGVGAGAALFGQDIRRRISFPAYLPENTQVPRLGHRTFQRDVLGLQEGVEAHHAQADRTLAQGRIFGAVHAGGRGLDEAGQDIVEHAQHVLDKAFFLRPLVPGFDIQGRQAAHRGALLAVMVGAGGQGDLAAQVGGVDAQPQLALVLGQRPVHRVDVQDIGLAGLQPGFQDTLPQLRGHRSRAAPCRSLGDLRPKGRFSFTHSMNSSVMLMP